MCNFRKYQLNGKNKMVNWLKPVKGKIGILKKMGYESKNRGMK